VILDTNALSAWAEGDRLIEPLLRSAASMMVPVAVLDGLEDAAASRAASISGSHATASAIASLII
jgi:rRNA-processing protein FCF1